jgi:hypothetical protein
MPPGQLPGTVAQEFHVMAHQLAERLRKLHVDHCSQPGRMPAVESREAKHGCQCDGCLKLDTFINDPTVYQVDLRFSSEGLAHHRRPHLPLISKESFAYRCRANTIVNGHATSYGATVRRTKDQLVTVDDVRGEHNEKSPQRLDPAKGQLRKQK